MKRWRKSKQRRCGRILNRTRSQETTSRSNRVLDRDRLERCGADIVEERLVAVKQLLSDSVDAHVANAFRKECNLMALLQKDGISHENLIQMLFCCWDRELLMLIEFCELGTVNDALSLNATADNHDDNYGSPWRLEWLAVWSTCIQENL